MKNYNNFYNSNSRDLNPERWSEQEQEKQEGHGDLLQSELQKRATLVGFLNEDIGTGDITSNLLIPEKAISKGTIVCKNIGKKVIVSGLSEAKIIFDICGCEAILLVDDGSKIAKGTRCASSKRIIKIYS